MIDKELLDILACPQCKADVKLEGEKIICTNPQCGLRYPIRDGVPVMLIDEAEKTGGEIVERASRPFIGDGCHKPKRARRPFH